MVDHSTFEVMERLVDEVGGSIGTTADDYHEEAVDAYEKFGYDFGNIRLLGETTPQLHEEKEEDLAEWDEDSVPCTFGIDASVTQEQTFTNGLRVVIANAKAGVVGNGDHRLADKSHVIATVYDEFGETGLDTHTVHADDRVTAELEVITQSDPSEARRMVQNLTRTFSEGRHLKTVVEEGGPGVVFVDGPVYPPLVLDEVVRREQVGHDDAWTDVLGSTVGTYLEAVSSAMDSGWPVIGVVKSMDSSSLINDLEKRIEDLRKEKVTLPWSKDLSFLTDLLYVEEPGVFTYTSWFVEEKRYSKAAAEDGSHYVDPLANAPYLTYDRDNYRRAFFFVRIPRTGTVSRVEVPAGFIRDQQSREFVQKRALAELAKMGDTTEPILRADKKARIGRDNQRELFDRLRGKMRTATDYNRDYRGPAYLGETED